MKTTWYFEAQVLRKRPYIQREWCERALSQPVHREIQTDGRVRYRAYIPELGKYFRVIGRCGGFACYHCRACRDAYLIAGPTAARRWLHTKPRYILGWPAPRGSDPAARV